MASRTTYSSNTEVHYFLAKYYSALPNTPQTEQELINRLRNDVNKVSNQVPATNAHEWTLRTCIICNANELSTEYGIRHQAELAWRVQGVWQNRHVALAPNDLRNPDALRGGERVGERLVERVGELLMAGFVKALLSTAPPKTNEGEHEDRAREIVAQYPQEEPSPNAASPSPVNQAVDTTKYNFVKAFEQALAAIPAKSEVSDNELVTEAPFVDGYFSFFFKSIASWLSSNFPWQASDSSSVFEELGAESSAGIAEALGSEDDTKIKEAFSAIPENLKQLLYHIKWVNDRYPTEEDYGHKAVENDPKILKEIHSPWLYLESGNIVTQLVALLQKEIHSPGIYRESENIVTQLVPLFTKEGASCVIFQLKALKALMDDRTITNDQLHFPLERLHPHPHLTILYAIAANGHSVGDKEKSLKVLKENVRILSTCMRPLIDANGGPLIDQLVHKYEKEKRAWRVR